MAELLACVYVGDMYLDYGEGNGGYCVGYCDRVVGICAGVNHDAFTFGCFVAETMDFVNYPPFAIALEIFYGCVGVLGTKLTEIIFECCGAVYFGLAFAK